LAVSFVNLQVMISDVKTGILIECMCIVEVLLKKWNLHRCRNKRRAGLKPQQWVFLSFCKHLQ